MPLVLKMPSALSSSSTASPTPTTLIILNSQIVTDPIAVKSITKQFPGNVHRQVLDRLIAGKAPLPSNTYSIIHIAPQSSPSSSISLDSKTLQLLYDSLVPGGVLSGAMDLQAQTLDAIMAGFLQTPDGLAYNKPDAGSSVASISRKPASARSKGTSNRLPLFKRSLPSSSNSTTVKLSLDDLNDLDDDDLDLVDENSLLDSSLSKPISIPPQCAPEAGSKKRRKACKDCTCGLKELELQEQEAQLAKQASTVVTLNLDEEIDFTVPGKTGGSCGSCALGDAFRCDGCPYLGLPPFKPGEIVNIASIRSDF